MKESAILLCVILFVTSLQCDGRRRRLKRVVERFDVQSVTELLGENETNEVQSSIYKTANKFFCEYPRITNAELILYGTKAWVFPRQNVNLTLAYPSQNEDKKLDRRYVITGFNVLLFMDNTDTQGFVNSGGILEDTINLSFTCNDVTTLLYEFWLFGVPADSAVVNDVITGKNNGNIIDMCSGAA